MGEPATESASDASIKTVAEIGRVAHPVFAISACDTLKARLIEGNAVGVDQSKIERNGKNMRNIVAKLVIGVAITTIGM